MVEKSRARVFVVGTVPDQRFVYLMANDRPEQSLPYRDILKRDVLCEESAGDGQRLEGLVGDPPSPLARARVLMATRAGCWCNSSNPASAGPSS
jgi:hypothetical protein